MSKQGVKEFKEENEDNKMMKRILIILLASSLVSSCVFRKVKMDETAMKNDLFYYDGNIKPFTGTCISYYDDTNQLKASRTYKDGLMNGIAVMYYFNGTVSKKGVYENGRLAGTWQGWYENGKQAYKVDMDNSKMNGDYMAFYENGKVKEKGRYKNNKKEGSWNYYNEYGILVQTKTY